MQRAMRGMVLWAVLLGSAACAWGLAWFICPGPLALAACACLAAAVNTVRPAGGGMVVHGTYRTRFLGNEWTEDVDVQPSAMLGAPARLVLAAFAPFTASAPLFALALRAPRPLPEGMEEWVALGSVGLLGLSALFAPGRELPLSRWRKQVEAGAQDVADLRAMVATLSARVHPSGAVGHVGGIGASVVGLHEVLDAERVLHAAEEQGVSEAGPLRAGLLEYLASQALPGGGFPVYPGGGGRLSFTVRALEALGDAVPPDARARHEDFVRRCAVDGGGYGRSPGQPATAEDTAHAARVFRRQG